MNFTIWMHVQEHMLVYLEAMLCLMCGRVKCTKCCIFFLFNPLNTKLNSICHLLALLGAHHILHISRLRLNCTRTI
jgi:hypothetical protein